MFGPIYNIMHISATFSLTATQAVQPRWSITMHGKAGFECTPLYREVEMLTCCTTVQLITEQTPNIT